MILENADLTEMLHHTDSLLKDIKDSKKAINKAFVSEAKTPAIPKIEYGLITLTLIVLIGAIVALVMKHA